MTAKRLLMISRCPPYPLHLGDRLIVWHLARELSGRGWTIDLLAFAQFESDYDEINEYSQFFRDVELIPEGKRTPFSYVWRLIAAGSRFPQEESRCWSPGMWCAIQGKLGVWDYDAIHLFGGVQVYEFYHALRGQPALITPYESYSLYLKRQIAQAGRWTDRIAQTIASQYERWMFTPYQSTVVVAQPDKDELLRLNPALDVRVISNGIDLAFFQPQPLPRKKKQLLFVGNYEYPPNVDAALVLAREILPTVHQHMPDVKLWLVGNAPPPEIQALASDTIEVTGRVPDVRPYLVEATVFVCPLRIGAGIKNKVLEAMAMGLPVVATPLSLDGIHAEPDESAVYAEVDGFAEAVLRLLRDEGWQRRLSDNGMALIQSQYSWGKAADLYEALYGDLR